VSPSSERLVESLAGNLQPVRPLPSLRRMALLVLAVGGVAAAGGVVYLGANPDLVEAARRYPAFLAIWVGLLVVAVGGVVAALAGAVPGREPEARAAFGVTALGAAIAVGLGGILAFGGPEAGVPAAPAWASGVCASMAALLALPAAAVVLGFVLRGAPGRPLAALAAAGAGAMALGSFANHMHCVQFDAAHLLMGHALAPLAGVLLLAVPAWLVLRRLAGPRAPQ
jgi:hypothetical protein